VASSRKGAVSGDYKETLERLYSLQKYGIKFGLSKTANLLRAFGNPHEGQRYIHVGGTNGKGSVGAMMESILMACGLRVGFYVSPHLVRFTERFRINGREMAPGEATVIARAVMDATDPQEPPTFFEFTTAMALIYFARQETDISIMEVGMGGRLDATNIIRPLVSIITNIGLEHQDFLGPRLRDIATEKAGIIKKGVDLVTGATQPSVIHLFRSVCEERGAPFWRVGRDVRYRRTGTGFNYYGLQRALKNLEVSLKGRHQFRNAALALAGVEILERKGYAISSECIRAGLGRTSWPGRMHVVSENPRVILDGAHNPRATKTLADSIRKDFSNDRVIVVLGVMGDKDIRGIIRAIAPIADHVIFTRAAYYRSAEPEVLFSHGHSLGIAGEIIGNLPDAIDRAKAMAGPHDLVLVCGSLFTVGEALAILDPERFIPDGA